MVRRIVPLAVLFCASSVLADHRALVAEQVQPLLDGKVIAGCVVGLIDNGQTEVLGFGVTKLGENTVPNGDTIYEIGSMTKALTGTLLADMVNRGELKLDAPLKSFLPADVTLTEIDGHPIRLVDLASQSSGLPRMPDNFAPKDPNDPYADYTAKELYAFLRTYKLTRPPGTYEYSNLGMGLLGNVMAEKSGKSYEAMLIDRICGPLKMSDTTVSLSDAQKARLAPPYSRDLSPGHNWNLNVLVGAGGVRSSANDMLKLLGAALNKDDKTPVGMALQKAFEQQIGPGVANQANPKELQRVGLGWHIAGDGVTRWHNGQTGGYSAAMYVHVPSKKAVVILCNTGTDLTTNVGEKIIQALFGMKPAPVDVRKTVEVPADVLKKYAGAYDLAPGARLNITEEGGKLMAQLTGQEKYQIFPTSETEFFYRIVDAQISFVVNEKGDVEKLILHQNGRNLPAVRSK